MILKLLFLLDSWLSMIDIKNSRHVKRDSKELMLVAWYPITRYNFCKPEDEKKKQKQKEKIDPFLIDEK